MNDPIPGPESPQTNARGAVIWGLILIVIGGIALAGQLWPDVERYIPLIVGLGLVLVFAITRSYIALVGAGVMTGLGVGIVVADLFPATDAAGAAVTLGLGIGFISVWLIAELTHLKEHHFWPLIPGTILALVGIGLSLDLFTHDWSKYVIPSIVLVIGVLVTVVGYVRMNRGHGGMTA